jgi:hypothetical protein
MLICCGARIVPIRSGWTVRMCCELGQLALRSVPPERGLSQSAAAGHCEYAAIWENSRSVCEFEIPIRTLLKPVES